MRLLRWYFDSWKQLLGGVGSFVGAVLFTGPAILTIALLLLYWGALPKWIGSASMAVFLIVAAPLVIFFAIVLVLGRIVDPFNAGARIKPHSNRPQPYAAAPQDLKTLIGRMISEQNRHFAMQSGVAMLMGLGFLVIIRWFILLFFRTIDYILTHTSVVVPQSAPEWATWSVLGVLAFSAYRKTDHLASVNTNTRLDSPAVMGSLGVTNPRIYIAAKANLLVEPFRLIFESIWLARSIRPERASDIEAAAKLLPEIPTDRSVRLPTTPEVLRILLRCRLIKIDPSKPREQVYLISEKAKDVLVEARIAGAVAAQKVGRP